LIVRCPYDTRTPQVPYTNDDDFSWYIQIE
jgi:hypothetical protein